MSFYFKLYNECIYCKIKFLYNKKKSYIKSKINCVGSLGPGVHYLPVYWACGPSREQESARVGEVFVRGDCVNE